MDKGQEKNKLMIFTNFDSSLFNFKAENDRPAKKAIAKLQERKIPLITVTNKTQAEIKDLRLALDCQEPSIVEYGSGVLILSKSDRCLIIF
jgi:mannosyl-3-phosphoglycerate phosphatase